jgi:nucleoside-diphosphate kinase
VIERTLAIVKPDGVAKKVAGEIITRYERNGLRIIALKMVRLSKEAAKGFYIVHRDRPFYESLTTFMSSGNSVVMILEGEEAIKRNRELMGATDPKQAAPGTIRRDFGAGIEQNVVHGSDSKQSADFEIPYFFSALEILP